MLPSDFTSHTIIIRITLNDHGNISIPSIIIQLLSQVINPCLLLSHIRIGFNMEDVFYILNGSGDVPWL
jgi:hypothetical protein